MNFLQGSVFFSMIILLYPALFCFCRQEIHVYQLLLQLGLHGLHQTSIPSLMGSSVTIFLQSSTNIFFLHLIL